MDELAQKVATLEAQTAYQYEDIKALKAENKETLRAFQEMRASLEVLNARLAASDRKHSNESSDLKSEVDRWVELGSRIFFMAISTYIAANIGGIV